MSAQSRAQDEWVKTCEAFRRIAAIEGPEHVADQIPAHRSTVYRLIRGETARPQRAVRRGIERIVQEHKQQEP